MCHGPITALLHCGRICHGPIIALLQLCLIFVYTNHHIQSFFTLFTWSMLAVSMYWLKNVLCLGIVLKPINICFLLTSITYTSFLSSIPLSQIHYWFSVTYLFLSTSATVLLPLVLYHCYEYAPQSSHLYAYVPQSFKMYLNM